MFRNVPAAIVTAGLLSVASAARAAEEDANIWLVQNATIGAGRNLVIALEAQERFTDDASRLGQLLLRPAVGYKLDASTTLFVGYAYVGTEPKRRSITNEHRVFQQLSFRLLGDGKGVTLTGRTRLEQRLFEEQSGTGLRLRQQLRLTAPVSRTVTAVLWSEPFIGLNKTRFQREGVGLWRNFVGINVPLGKNFRLEPGYLNQYVVRNGADRIDHIANIAISASF